MFRRNFSRKSGHHQFKWISQHLGNQRGKLVKNEELQETNFLGSSSTNYGGRVSVWWYIGSKIDHVTEKLFGMKSSVQSLLVKLIVATGHNKMAVTTVKTNNQLWVTCIINQQQHRGTSSSSNQRKQQSSKVKRIAGNKCVWTFSNKYWCVRWGMITSCSSSE